MLAAFAVALGQDEHYFEQWFDAESHNHPKVIRYPGRGEDVDDQGVGAHWDYGFLALLVQGRAGGLQVQSLDGEWLDAAPLPGSFVFNIGEMLEVMTSGYLRATVHRVVSPPGDVDRCSVPFFLGLASTRRCRSWSCRRTRGGGTGIDLDPTTRCSRTSARTRSGLPAARAPEGRRALVVRRAVVAELIAGQRSHQTVAVRRGPGPAPRRGPPRPRPRVLGQAEPDARELAASGVSTGARSSRRPTRRPARRGRASRRTSTQSSAVGPSGRSRSQNRFQYGARFASGCRAGAEDDAARRVAVERRARSRAAATS